MKNFVLFWMCSSLLVLGGCGGEEEGSSKKNKETIGVNGTLTQLGKAATEDECPNGGVTLEHGIDKNEDGELNPDEVSKTYVLCHGRDGVNGNDGIDADVTALQAELDALKAAVELNTAKVGYSDELVAASPAVATNSAKVGVSDDLAAAVVANSAKVSFPGFGTTAGTALEGNFAESDPVFSAHAANTISTGDITNWDIAFGWGDHSAAVAENAAKLASFDFSGLPCAAGYAGPSCIYSDALNCTGNGTVANDGSCTCATGWTGSSCADVVLTGTADNGDGTVTDHDLGITWMKCAQGMVFDSQNNTCTGTKAMLQYCNMNDNSCNGGVTDGILDGGGNSQAWDTCSDLNYASHSDWRVPNKEELKSLIKCTDGTIPTDWEGCGSGNYAVPTIDTGLFPNFPSANFWTSTSSANPSGAAWYVHFANGTSYGLLKVNSISVLCVR